MPKETPRITKNKWMEEPLTRGKMEPIIADLKDFIRATAKGTENVLRKEMQDMRIELTEKINGAHTELSEKMDRVISKVGSNEEKIETHLTAHP